MPGSGRFVPVGRAESFGPGGHFIRVEGRVQDPRVGVECHDAQVVDGEVLVRLCG